MAPNPGTVSSRLAWAAAAVAAVASLAGVAVTGLYRDGEALIRTTRADDSFRLFMVLPVLAIGLWAGRRGSVGGRLVALGALACLAYLYAFAATAAHINAMSLAQIAALGLSTWALLLGLGSVDPKVVAQAVDGRLLRRTTGVFLLAIAALSAVNWSAVLLGAAISGVQPADIEKLGLATNPLYTIELAFLVPAFAVAGIRLLRGDRAGAVLALPLLVLLVLLGIGLAWEAAGIAAFGGAFDAGQAVAGIVFAALPALLLLPIVVRRRPGSAPGEVAAA